MIKMIVFDMAGTTVDEDNVVYKTLHKTVNDAGYEVSFEQVLETGAGKEKLQAIRDILSISSKHPEPGLAENLYQYFDKSLEIAYDNINVKPQEGAEKLFKTLQQNNILVILNTGYNEKTARDLLTKLNWKEGAQIDGLVTATDVSNNRPMPDMILLAMKQFSITNAKQVVKIGDSVIDIEEGKNAGCNITIGITTGAHTHEQLSTASPDYIVNSLNEIPAILKLTV